MYCIILEVVIYFYNGSVFLELGDVKFVRAYMVFLYEVGEYYEIYIFLEFEDKYVIFILY